MGYNKALWDKGIRSVAGGPVYSKSVTDILAGRSAVDPRQLSPILYKQYLYAKGQDPKKDPTYQRKLAEKRKVDAIKTQRASRTLQAQSDVAYAKQVQQAQQQNVQAQKVAEQVQAVKTTRGIDQSKLQASANAPKTEAQQIQSDAKVLRDTIKPEVIEAQQPDPELVSPYLKAKQTQQSDQGETSPVKQPEKEFAGPEKPITGSIQYNYGAPKIDAIVGNVASPIPVTITETESTYITGSGVPYGPPKPREKTDVEKWFASTEKLLAAKSDNPVIEGLKGFGQFGLSVLAGGINLEQIGGKALVESFTGKKQGTTPVAVPKTFDQPVIEGLVGGGIASYQSGNLTKFSESVQKGAAQSYQLMQEQGLPRTGGQVLGFILPTGKNPSPIKLPTLKIPVESGKVRTVARGIELGYGSKRKPLYEKVRTAELALGEPTELGLAIPSLGKFGVRIFTKEESLTALEKVGKALPRDVQAARIWPEIAKLAEKSSKVVPQSIRQKVRTIPDEPLSRLSIKENKAIKEEIIPKLATTKGTLSETVQLDTDLVKVVTGSSPSKVRQALPKGDPRAKTTKDLDTDYGNKILGNWRAKRMQEFGAKTLQKVAEPGHEFRKVGRNVKLFDKGKDQDVVLNILTKRDAIKGYGNKPTKPFEINLKRRDVKVETSKGSGKFGKFVSIEENLMNRINAAFAWQGPKTEKFAGKGRPDYLKEGFEDVLRTEKGYTFGPVTYNLKHIAKAISQDAEQISRNLRKAGYSTDAARFKELKEQMMKLYPEIDFGKIKYEDELSEAGLSSLFSRAVSTGTIISKDSAAMLGLSTSKSTGELEFYHGTTAEAAKKLLEKGPRFDKEKTTFFLTPTYKEAKHWGSEVLKVKLKPETKFLTESKLPISKMGKDPFAVAGLPTDEEIVLFSKKPIEKIEKGKPTSVSKYSKSILGSSTSKSSYRSVYNPVSKPASKPIKKTSSLSKSTNKVLGSIGSVGDSTGTSKSASLGKSKGISLGPSKGSSFGPSTGPSTGSPGSPGKLGSGTGSSLGSFGGPSRRSLAQSRRPPIGIFVNWKTTQKKRIEEPKEKKVDFFGSTHIEKIEGFRSKKIDIEYGDIKTAKKARKDILGTRGKRPRVKLI